MKYIQITLLSDACIGSGEIYNCLVDADVCYDNYGLPYIPAKRIKGCLREAGQELRDWGEQIPVDKIFGAPDYSSAAVRISNANLCAVSSNEETQYDYEDYRNDLVQSKNEKYVNAENVLEQFTYIRTQTAIDSKTGTAKRNSLRNIRVLRKGLVFRAKIDFSIKKGEQKFTEKELIKYVEKCCKAMKTMGLNRTRGMGEVRVEIKTDTKEVKQLCQYNGLKGKEKVKYTIQLDAPLLTRSISAGQDVTENYIEGAKMLGFIAHHIKDYEKFCKNDEFICSNAYISKDGKRYLPASASLYGVKNKSDAIRDKAITEEENSKLADNTEQLNSLGDIFVEENTGKLVHTIEVNTEIRYHHSRPEDKSKGHANAKLSEIDLNVQPEECGEFYQLQSLSQGQSFTGYILGTKNQINKVIEILKRHSKTRMGYNRSSEYGEVTLHLAEAEEKPKFNENYQEFVLKLEAPMIQYNANGMYSTDVQIILDEVKKIVGIQDLKITKEFLKFKMLQGYNTTWNQRKPTIFAFDKGTTLVIKSEQQKVDLNLLKDQWLGERVNEGFGEISVYPLSNDFVKEKKSVTSQEYCESEKKYKTDLVPNIVRKIKLEQITQIARQQAKEYVRDYSCNVTLKPLIYQLWGQMNKKRNIEEVLENIFMSEDKTEQIQQKNSFLGNSERAKKKKELAKIILKADLKELSNQVKEPSIIELEEKEIRDRYFHALLEEMKYQVSHKEEEESGEK